MTEQLQKKARELGLEKDLWLTAIWDERLEAKAKAAKAWETRRRNNKADKQ